MNNHPESAAPGAVLRAWLDAQAQARGGYVAFARAAGLSWQVGRGLARGSIPQPTTLARLLWLTGADRVDARSLWDDAHRARSRTQRPRRGP